MSEITFEVTPKQQLSMLTRIFVVYGAIGIVYVYLQGFTLKRPFLIIFLVMFSLDILPALIAHIQYWIANKNAILKIDKEHQQLSYATPTGTQVHNFDDIISLQHFASYAGGSWYSFSEYRYFKITFKDNNEIIVTCLMVADIKDVFELLLSRKAEKKLSVVAFIK
jgi:hypothetical protein